MSMFTDFIDWFSKAKDAKKAATAPNDTDAGRNNSKYGMTGHGSQAYRDAQEALDNENKPSQVASGD